MATKQKGIGQDIAEVIGELGMSIEILEREDGIVLKEKIDYESNTQLTKPFTAEHYLQASFTYKSQVLPGDLIRFVNANLYYRVMNVFDESFEDSVIYKQCIIYKCNAFVTVWRPDEYRDKVSYDQKQIWKLRYGPDIRCLLTDKLYGSRLDTETQDIIQMDLRGRVLYFPAKWEVMVKDRVTFTHEKVPYMVTNIENNTFPGMSVVYLEEDTRASVYDEIKPKKVKPLLP